MEALLYLISVFCTPCPLPESTLCGIVSSIHIILEKFLAKLSGHNPLCAREFFYRNIFLQHIRAVSHVVLMVNNKLILMEFTVFLENISFYNLCSLPDIFLITINFPYLFFSSCHRIPPITSRYSNP